MDSIWTPATPAAGSLTPTETLHLAMTAQTTEDYAAVYKALPPKHPDFDLYDLYGVSAPADFKPFSLNN